MTDLRNVIVFSVGAHRYGLEIRWVREVATLGFVTVVPSAPRILSGVCNWHGQIIAVVDLAGAPYSALARQGDGALVIDVGNTLLAVRIEKIDRVVSLAYQHGVLQDGSADGVTLLNPEAIHLALRTDIERVGERVGEIHSSSTSKAHGVRSES